MALSNDNVSDLEDRPKVERHDLENELRGKWLRTFHAAVQVVVVEGKATGLEGGDLEIHRAAQEEAQWIGIGSLHRGHIEEAVREGAPTQRDVVFADVPACPR